MSIQEKLPLPGNPLGIDGVEFIEYATAEPLALGAILEKMGFVPVGRHRSREILLYRQGAMNIVVNADPASRATGGADHQAVTLSAIALRVRDAGAAYAHAVQNGAWAIETRAGAMELNIPGIHGVGNSTIYFVDRYKDFSIYDVDFKRLAAANDAPPALAGMHFFGVVQAIRADRGEEWIAFYRRLLHFEVLPEGTAFGVLPRGRILQSPCGKFYLQLIEPQAGSEEVHWYEELIRIGIGTPDVVEAGRELAARGVVFVDRPPVQMSTHGAVTSVFRGSVSFELVHSSAGEVR